MILTITDRERELQTANAELRAELAKIKQQEPVATVTRNGNDDYTIVYRTYQAPIEVGARLYLAPGAQPVPYLEQALPMSNFQCKCGRAYGFPQQAQEGMVLVPIEPNVNMYVAGAEALTQHALLLKSVGRSTDMIHTSDEALSRKMFKAMLEAAKP